METKEKPVIQVKNLYKLYRVGDSYVKALNGVNLEIYKGEFCSIVGTSGSGKSTLLNMLAGLEKPTRVKLSSPVNIWKTKRRISSSGFGGSISALFFSRSTCLEP